MEELRCPFCGYKTESHYRIMYHMEDIHPEGESPFIVKNGPNEVGSTGQSVHTTKNLEDELEFVDCPREGCGEKITLTELDSHIDLHGVEDDEAEDDSYQHPAKRQRRISSSSESYLDKSLPQAQQNLGGISADLPLAPSGNVHSGDSETVKATWRELLNMSSQKNSTGNASSTTKSHRRLGKAELGPYAHEKQMPQWLKRLLETDGQNFQVRRSSALFLGGKAPKAKDSGNHVPGIIPIVKRLLQQNPSTEYAYTCHQTVQHISKLPREGGFCGYRNIQMLISYIIGTQSEGHQHFKGKIPSIFQIQDFIERAWDLGIHAQGRQETGGVRGTRKYIGTPEAQAMLISLDIPCVAQGLKSQALTEKVEVTKNEKNNGNTSADQILFEYVENYFSVDCMTPELKIRGTELPPLYLQHPGHSLTIIGFEKSKDGGRNILVFDPMFYDSSDVTKLVGQPFSHTKSGDLLRAYRRTSKYLRKYREFEVLRQEHDPVLQSNINRAQVDFSKITSSLRQMITLRQK